MTLAIDPENFKLKSVRDPKDIAADILDFPLDKSPIASFDRSQRYMPQWMFSERMSDIIQGKKAIEYKPDSDAMARQTELLRVLEAIGLKIRISETSEDKDDNVDLIYKNRKLLEGLRALRKGDPLSTSQKLAMRRSLQVIEAMAQMDDSFAYYEKEAMDPNGFWQQLQKKVREHYGKPVDSNFIEQDCVQLYASHLAHTVAAYNLRQGIKPLFHELAVSLSIKLDAGPALGKK
ncbi:MAG: hypothetical protein KGJ06_04140 [Pseudomonadota bacterium]|nr:hypothetical protein [Pseudomonadota bacterium]